MRINVAGVIKPDEIQSLINKGIIDHKDDILKVQVDGITYLINICNSHCLVPKNRKLVCRAKKYQKSKENKKHVLDQLPNNFTKQCLIMLEKAGVVEIERNKTG